MRVVRNPVWLMLLALVPCLAAAPSRAVAAAAAAPATRPSAAPVAAAVHAPSLATAHLDWSESFVQATRLARQQDKIILAYFCGSDWCEWCKKLDKEVLT